MKNKQKKQVWGVLIGGALFAITASVQAGSVTGLTSFTANTTAKSSEVNGNFTAVQTAVNDNDSRLTTVEGTVGTNSSNISSLQSTVNANSADISTLQSNPSITGNLTLPESTSANTGNIMKGTVPFLSDYGTDNTFLGENAGNFGLTTAVATDNTALGYKALTSIVDGYYNTASGSQALYSNTEGRENVANGRQALYRNTTGYGNTATGSSALYANTTGYGNTADGASALPQSTGNFNIGVGYGGGSGLTSGSYNIDIGNDGSNGESSTIRIGNASTQTRAFIAGIYGITTASSTGYTVVVDSNGQLGTILSSRRFKDHIRSMGDASDVLNKLHPVTFYYKTDHDPKGRHLQYGLVAEDVAKVAPTLVSYGKDGKTEGVYYRFLAPMLLNQYQRQEKVIAAQGAQLHAQKVALVNQNALLHKQAKEIVALRKQSARVALLEKQMARINTILAMRQGENKVASTAGSWH